VISFACTADQIRSAPLETRSWVEAEIVSALRDAAIAQLELAHSSELAVCTPDEAFDLQVYSDRFRSGVGLPGVWARAAAAE
jgi:hypothetical protein